MNIITKLIPTTSRGRRPQIPMKPEYITIHSTGNPNSTAKNEAMNVINNLPNRQVSFHYVVDDKEIYNVIPANEVAWHAGDGRGTGNMKSIGIELCESGDRALVLMNGVRLVAMLMEQYNIPLDKVVQHNFWSGKNCPRILRDPSHIRNGMNWGWFKTMIEQSNMTVEQAMDIVKEKAELSDSTIHYLLNYQYGETLILKLAKAML